jgi:hypothetical protein
MLYKIIALHGDLLKKNTFISYIHLEETGGVWSYEQLQVKKIEIGFSSTIPIIMDMPIMAFIKLDVEVGKKLATEIMHFMDEYSLAHKIDFISMEGVNIIDHLHVGNAAVIASQISLPVISNFYDMNTALNGNDNIFDMATEKLQINPANAEQKNIALALLAALRWRESNNILAKNTNATKDHIAGSIWLGVEA